MNSTAKAVEAFLSKIERTKDLNIFLEVWADEALKRANKIDLKISEGKAGKLAGMVIAIKDNICYRGHKVSAASEILEGFESQFSATAVERLLNEDAVFIGRTNCDEFAMGSANENSAFGPVKNPVDPTKVPGGSSGGSAAAVAAGLCHVALGSDTGGSIRQPAAFTGTVGFKPSYGRISRHGLIAYASSFDQIGPFASNVADAAKVMEVMAGADDFDATAIQSPMAPAGKLIPKKIAYLKTALDHPKVDISVKKAFQAQLELLENAGCEVEPVEFELLDTLVPVYYILTTAEASSNLARFDGVHAGFRAQEVSDLESVYKRSRSAGFGKEVQRRIMLGTFVLSAGYYDAYFGKAQAVRRMVKDWTDKTLSEFDVLLCPTTPSTAFELGREVNDPTVNYLEDIFTVQANIAGTPAVSIPIGVDSSGLPIGLQVMGANGSDMDTLAMAAWIQKQ
ncbi:Asp-tRNA(Asn)/Glu-tRNA(Gln) amidotransferase subunit GatA [Schleiferiaceae bacterium]|nr:Asp-tRNA(Asn)/Glu-tRNA(Gln) amidotransferase subunit GatA [Schleiferiaceae bacterium]